MTDKNDAPKIILIVCVSIWIFFAVMAFQGVIDSTVVIHPTLVAGVIGTIALILIGAVKLW